MALQRCEWAEKDVLSCQYHDKEWGVPSFDDRYLFEMLILEGAQAGLSWSYVLKRREAYRQVLHNFQPALIMEMEWAEFANAMATGSLIRHPLKARAIRPNACAFVAVVAEFGTFADYIWSFTGGKQIVNHWQTSKDVPTQSPLSQKVGRDLKKRGFAFVGPTICYAYLQAIGVINDHTVDCFRWSFCDRNLV